MQRSAPNVEQILFLTSVQIAELYLIHRIALCAVYPLMPCLGIVQIAAAKHFPTVALIVARI